MKISAICSAVVDGHRTVGRDDPAEGAHRVARVRLAVGLGQRVVRVGADGDAAGVRVLDDRDARLGVVVGGPAGGVGVDVVVVGHLLAVVLHGFRDALTPRAARRAPPAGAGSRRSAARRIGSRRRRSTAGSPRPPARRRWPARRRRPRRSSRCGRTPRRPAAAATAGRSRRFSSAAMTSA